jgi:hypothetical protein
LKRSFGSAVSVGDRDNPLGTTALYAAVVALALLSHPADDFLAVMGDAGTYSRAELALRGPNLIGPGQGLHVPRGQQLGFAFVSAPPDRANGVDDPPGWQPEPTSWILGLVFPAIRPPSSETLAPSCRSFVAGSGGPEHLG